MSTVASTAISYLGAHHGAPQTKIAGGLLGCAVTEMAIRTVVNLGVVMTKGPGHERHKKNLGINFASTIVWGTLAANVVPGFAIIGLFSYCAYSSIFLSEDNAYFTGRICRKAVDLGMPVMRRICGVISVLFSSMRGVLDHPIGAAGIFIAVVIAFYHGPVVIVSKIAEATGLTTPESS